MPGADLPKYDRTNLSIVEIDSEMPSDPAHKMFDGEDRTFWHSRYGENAKDYPHVITFKLEDETQIAGLYLQNRNDHNENGFIKRLRIHVSIDGERWQKVAEDQLRRTAKEQRIVFENPVRVRYVKLTALSAIHGHAYASIAELGVLLER